MYLSAKGVFTGIAIGAIGGAGIGFALDAPGKGAAIGAGAGLLLPLIAEAAEGMFDSEKADAVNAIKKLRAAVIAKDATKAAEAQQEVAVALAALATPEKDKK